MTMRYMSLGMTIFGFWLLLSGHYTNFLLVVGVICSALIVFFSAYMRIVDVEGHPIELLPRALIYWPWLIVEIFKSSWIVSMIILDRRLPVSPTVSCVSAGSGNHLGINVYANSITLTPGTVAIEANRQNIVVHALLKEGADDLGHGAMAARVSWLGGWS